VAQIFKSLDLSIASVVPFTLTSASNKDGAKVTFKGTQSDVRTGPAGSLTITAPKPGELGIGGGGTVYTSTALSGFRIQVHFVSADADVTERDGFDRGCKIFLQGIDNASRAASATVEAITKKERLASLTTDETGTGKVKYSDGSSAALRGFLAGD
jgi:hypothetical protein